MTLQHLLGLASALLLYLATRRVIGSGWAGLLPAAFLLLSPDQIFLEHAIMSESWAVFAMSVGLAATVLAFDEGRTGWRWAGAGGAALIVSATIRSRGDAVNLGGRPGIGSPAARATQELACPLARP